MENRKVVRARGTNRLGVASVESRFFSFITRACRLLSTAWFFEMALSVYSWPWSGLGLGLGLGQGLGLGLG